MKDLSIYEITLQSWPEVEGEIMLIEKTFHINLQQPPEDFIEILGHPRHIALVLKLNNVIIGNIFGSPLELDEWIKELTEDPTFGQNQHDTIHLCSIVIEPKYQRRGYARLLVQEFICWSRRLGYKKIGGFFREKSSLPLVEQFGAKKIKPFHNWADTGETYWYAEIDLELKQ